MDPDLQAPAVGGVRRRPTPARSSRRGHRCVTVGLVLALAGALAAPAVAAAPAETTTLCAAARELTDDGYPQRAVALVAAAQGGADASPCPDARDEALVAIAEAQRLADDEDFDAALATDAENATAKAALAAGPQSWDAFWAEVAEGLEPGWALLLAVAVLTLVLAVVARLIAPYGVGPWRAPVWASSLLTLLGFAGVVAAGSQVLLLLRSRGSIDHWDIAAWFWLALLATVAFAIGLATRLRVTVVAKDDVTAGHVIALLGELGARPPEGLEVPRGADVDTLGGGALDSLPEGRVVKTVTAVMKTLLGTTPWRVMVDVLDDGSIAVAMTRNGRGMGTAFVESAVLGLPTATDEEKKTLAAADLHRFVAAFVMVTLAQHHRGFDGLCGARDWRSLGLHYVATTDFKDDDERKTAILVSAVNADPGNWLAQVALASARWRESSRWEDLELYLRWLDAATPADRRRRLLDDDPKLPTWPQVRGADAALSKTDASPLLARMLLTRAKVAINAECARSIDTKTTPLLPPGSLIVRTAVGDLVRFLADADRPRRWRERLLALVLPVVFPSRVGVVRGDVFLERIRAEAAVLDGLLRGRPGIPEADRPDWDPPRAWVAAASWPSLRYSEGCTAATHADAAHGTPGSRERAVALLSDAAVRAELREWMSQDPQLATVRAEWGDVMDGVRPEAEQDLFALDLYAAHTTRFTELGIAYPADVARCRVHDLVDQLKITRIAAQRLIDVAAIHEAASGHGLLARYRVELLRIILAKGPGVSAAQVVAALRARLWLRSAELRAATGGPRDLVDAIDSWIALLFPGSTGAGVRPHGSTGQHAWRRLTRRRVPPRPTP